MFDMINRRALVTKDIKLLIIDEADELLSKGFKEQIYDIYRYLPPKTQVSILRCLFPFPLLDSLPRVSFFHVLFCSVLFCSVLFCSVLLGCVGFRNHASRSAANDRKVYGDIFVVVDLLLFHFFPFLDLSLFRVHVCSMNQFEFW